MFLLPLLFFSQLPLLKINSSMQFSCLLLCVFLLVDSAPTLPPAYESIKDYKDCLSELPNKKDKCLPNQMPKGCKQETWDKLHGLTGADKLASCSISRPIDPLGQYRSIKDWEKCLSTSSYVPVRVYCQPESKPNACPDDSWKSISALSGEDKLKSCPKRTNNFLQAIPLK